MFKELSGYGDDPIEGMFARLGSDRDPAKIDLGIGVYRDESGKVPVMRAVREAEKILLDKKLPKSYMTPFGNRGYCRDIERLVLGEDHDVLAVHFEVFRENPPPQRGFPAEDG